MPNPYSLARIDAVPGTGGRRSWRGVMRRPRHIAVWRFLCGVRGAKLPPTDWDEMPRRSQRSWKMHRSRQFRPTGP